MKMLSFFCSGCPTPCDIPYQKREYSPHMLIASGGSHIHHLLMLDKGCVHTQIIMESGATLSLEIIEAPFPLEAAFLYTENNKLPVSVTAESACTVYFITKEKINDLIASCPQFRQRFLTFVANRVQILTEHLSYFAQKTIDAKLAYYILSIENHGLFTLERNISSLADYFGVERPSLSRIISRLSRERIITLKNGKGEILNRKALALLLG